MIDTATWSISRVRNLLDEGGTTTDSNSNTNNILAGHTIMVMDDEENVRELFKINLEKLGCKIIEACDGDEAIAIYQQSLKGNPVIDAVIMDLSVPGGLGRKEVANKIRALNPHARLIVASGDSSGPEMTHF